MKIQYVIAIHLLRWLTNSYDFRFKWTATAAIGIHLIKAWLSPLMNFKNAIWILEERYVIKFCFKLGKNAMRWKLDLLLWPKNQETEFLVEACWLSQTQEGQTEQIPHKPLMIPFLTTLAWSTCAGFPLDSQQGILCWGFKGVQEVIPREEASTQIGSVAFPPEQCTSPQLYPCHRLFDLDGHQDSSSPLHIVKTLLPVTFAYSLSSMKTLDVVVMR